MTVNEAKELYNSGNANLIRLALKAFSEEELKEPDYKEIQNIADVYNILDIDRDSFIKSVKKFPYYNRIVAQYDLENIHRAINGGWKPELCDSVYYPAISIHRQGTVPYNDERSIVGCFKYLGTKYVIIGNKHSAGRLPFERNWNIVLGKECKDIDTAKHISKYFYKYIMAAHFIENLNSPIIFTN